MPMVKSSNICIYQFVHKSLVHVVWSRQNMEAPNRTMYAHGSMPTLSFIIKVANLCLPKFPHKM